MLPAVQPDEWRRIRGEQDIIVRYEPARALETLPTLVTEAGDRDRLVALYQRLLADKRFQGLQPTEEQNAMLGRARDVLRARYAVAKPKSPARPMRAG
jgi:Mlc titration factor MtfA (ptsG expression regulator)